MAEQAKEWDRLWINARLATMIETGAPYGTIDPAEGGAALAVKDGRIAYSGPMKALPRPPQDMADVIIDAERRWITPGLIDCHTHIIFAGTRAGEFEMRLAGASYEDIAVAGGGILSTVHQTREAGEEQLIEAARSRLSDFLSDGVTTIEIKSGYGLNTETEMKMLRAARRLGEELPVGIVTTYLGAHAVPPEFNGDTTGYLDQICDQTLPQIAEAGLADAVDAFCEGIAFTPDEVRRVFEKSKALGLAVKLHADQLSDSGGAALAAEFGALSADHLEYAGADGIRAMAGSGTVAVLLPGAFHTLGAEQAPPVAGMRAAGVQMAVASDCNPGSSPVRSLRLMANMACAQFGLTAEEALAGITRVAAKALGLGDEIGTLEVGKRADFVLWDIDQPAELAYWIGGNLCNARVRGGKIVR